MRLGIDFGTCYSSAALLIDGVLHPVKEPSKPLEYCFPSSVCVTKKGDIVISQAAENQRRLNPQGYKNHFKRDLATDIPYFLGEQQLRFMPEDLVAIMLAGLKQEAEKIINSSLDSAVITVPATYLINKKQLMEQAAKEAGFTEVTLLEEPVAAAIYYSQKGKMGHQVNEGDILLVYDLGGGTFDAALIQKKGNSYELLSQPVGDKECGGIYFDRLIGKDLIEQLNDPTILELFKSHRQDKEALRAKLNLEDWCRNFKHQLSVLDEYEDFPPLSSDSYSLSRARFEAMISPSIDSSCHLCQQLVEQSGIKWETINRVLLVGGSCRIPCVQKRLEQQFKCPVVAIDDPELAICFGAAIYGEELVPPPPLSPVSIFSPSEDKRKERQERKQLKGEREKSEPALSTFEFQVATITGVVSTGFLGLGKKALISRNQGKAQYYTEDLGNGVTLEMVAIPGGIFLMGAPETEAESLDNERPQHQVTVKPFFMGKYLVTQAQWRAVASLPKVNLDLNPEPSGFKGERRPVEGISWYDAVEFCARLSKKTKRTYRLPTEAEWEYACRAGTTSIFHFGETITTDLANYQGTNNKYIPIFKGFYGEGPKGEYREQTTPVGSFPPNAFGLYDMHGNVWEWCEDDWHENFQGAPTDGSAWLSENNSRKVRRGGTWDNVPKFCRSAFRIHSPRDYHKYRVGFRVVCVAPRAT